MFKKKPKIPTAANDYADAPAWLRGSLRRQHARRLEEKVERESQPGFNSNQKAKTKAEHHLREYRAAMAEAERHTRKKIENRSPVDFEPFTLAQLEVLFADDLSALSKLLFFTLEWHTTMSEEKAAFPTQERLAGLLNRKKRQIQNALVQLKNRGYLEIALRRVGYHLSLIHI